VELDVKMRIDLSSDITGTAGGSDFDWMTELKYGTHQRPKLPVVREEVRPVKSEIAIYDFRNFDLCKVRKFMV
jgi:hypothetical protein